MTREKQIIQIAKQKEKEDGFTQIVHNARGVYSAYGIGFLEGAEWADENPRKGLVNINKACAWLHEHSPFGDVSFELRNEIIEDLKKYMEE